MKIVEINRSYAIYMNDNLSALEQNLQVPVLQPNDQEGRNKSLSEFVQSLNHDAEFGVLFRVVEHPNSLKKIISLVWLAVSIWLIRFRLRQVGANVQASFGVYPSVEDPVTIYELNSEAEQYINRYVLPTFPHGINGDLRKLVMKMTRLHPSLAGVVVLARKT